MVRSKMFASVAMLAVLAGSAVAPLAANADGFQFGNGGGHQIQAQKNDWRNAAIVSGAVALFGLATHQKAATIGGAIGTVVAVNQFEKDQNIQNDRNCRQDGYRQDSDIGPDRGFGNIQFQSEYRNRPNIGRFENGYRRNDGERQDQYNNGRYTNRDR